MKLDRTVVKETGIVTVIQVCLCAIMLIIYYFVAEIGWSELIGAIVGSALAVGNFFGMCLTVQKAVNSPEEEHSKLMMASQMLRLALIAVIIVICLAVFKLDPIATLIPLLFPRLSVFIRTTFMKSGGDADK